MLQGSRIIRRRRRKRSRKRSRSTDRTTKKEQARSKEEAGAHTTHTLYISDLTERKIQRLFRPGHRRSKDTKEPKRRNEANPGEERKRQRKNQFLGKWKNCDYIYDLIIKQAQKQKSFTIR